MRWEPQTAMQSARAHLRHWQEQRAYNTDSHRTKQCDGFIRQCNIVILALQDASKRARK